MSEQIPKAKILIVDDVPTNIRILHEGLKQEGEIYFATSGEKALEIVVQEHPDLVLLDILMPDMSGYEVCRQLKSDSTTSGIPVIFITSLQEEEDETRGFEAGAIDYIIKPFRMPIIRARVRTHLELKRRGDLLKSLSNRDGLTGIANRRSFDETLDSEWNRAKRLRSCLSLVMVDIDHFKLFNDHYGHIAGDECLRWVAQALKQSLRRACDFVSRYGGEEFVCILPETDLDEALKVAEHLRSAVAELAIPHAFSTVVGTVTISMGVASMMPLPEKASVDLMLAADQALYQAKNTGRNRVCYFQDNPR
ncbi:MAG: PleD family two-component system response regulator [Proteobacteria bacterium]|nr:PleD family two-component system response regulator [Desulfobulbaceae bacterium]MBU4153697.1 PleD family two-component system response regulator [Pseudomonadota bacterium]MDP2106844.1 PleD family two-component system response regulator [Desulfobulbaceae bacterium]